MTVQTNDKELNQIVEDVTGYANGVALWRKHAIVKNVVFTDLFTELIEKINCKWVLDDVAIFFTRKAVEGLNVVSVDAKNGKADIIMYRDYDSRMSKADNYKEYGIYKKHYTYTDLPNGEMKFYLFNEIDIDGTYKIFFPSEY